MGRTSKNIKLRIPEKPHKIKGFRSGSYRVATTISSQARYDHFDTPPCNSYSIFKVYNHRIAHHFELNSSYFFRYASLFRSQHLL